MRCYSEYTRWAWKRGKNLFRYHQSTGLKTRKMCMYLYLDYGIAGIRKYDRKVCDARLFNFNTFWDKISSDFTSAPQDLLAKLFITTITVQLTYSNTCIGFVHRLCRIAYAVLHVILTIPAPGSDSLQGRAAVPPVWANTSLIGPETSSVFLSVSCGVSTCRRWTTASKKVRKILDFIIYTYIYTFVGHDIVHDWTIFASTSIFTSIFWNLFNISENIIVSETFEWKFSFRKLYLIDYFFKIIFWSLLKMWYRATWIFKKLQARGSWEVDSLSFFFFRSLKRSLSLQAEFLTVLNK